MELAATDNQSSAKKRAPKACRRCRRQKIRCTGSRPCEACAKRKLTCHFDDHAQKILVTRGYINDLEKRVASFERQSRGDIGAPGISDEQATPEETLEPEENDEDDNISDSVGRQNLSATYQPEASYPQSPSRPPEEPRSLRGSPGASLMNPLVLGFPSYFPDTSGRPIYLGTSSNWSFGRRVLAMTHERVMRAPLPPDNLLFEGKSYDLGWDGKRNTSLESPSEGPALPSADFAMYLINAVKFHCGQLFHLFEEDKFMQQFSQFHENPTQAPSSLWFIHYLLILAFGKAFPPGAELFVHAMKLMPDLAFYSADPIEAIQVLCCAALYLQCLDFRGAAYRIIGQALRMALENGMHTEMRSQQVDSDLAQRYRKVWWTVYILDRQMSSLMGVPMGIADESISAELPTFSGQPQRSTAMNIQINLSKVLAQILNTVYGAEGRLDKRFLTVAKDALKSVANVTDQLNSSFEFLGNGSKTSISRLSAYLHLLYHQCIVLTTRPILYTFLQSKLRQSNINLVELLQSGSVRTLLQMCIESAQQMITILSALQDHSLLESFLPFDLDATFTSAIALLMAATVDSSLVKDCSPWLQRSHAVFDEMISRGNRVARMIKSELQQLENILNRLSSNEENQPVIFTRPSSLRGSLSQDDRHFRTAAAQPSLIPLAPPPYTASSQPTNNDFPMDELSWQDGITAEQLLNFADSMDLSALDWLSAEAGQ
ncbi:Fungal Zn2-Cys6 binuclear cluster domain-containing protein [Cladophialophora immunda]|nr:Fungal Zn2-Cys6 binuclear cluster domain-containing protein [Cladophialophora immunda]